MNRTWVKESLPISSFGNVCKPWLKTQTLIVRAKIGGN
jgi:hypothetical protein